MSLSKTLCLQIQIHSDQSYAEYLISRQILLRSKMSVDRRKQMYMSLRNVICRSIKHSHSANYMHGILCEGGHFHVLRITCRGRQTLCETYRTMSVKTSRRCIFYMYFQILFGFLVMLYGHDLMWRALCL